MKRLLILLMLFISIGAQGQSTIDHLGKIRMRYNNSGSNDTLLIQFSGDSTYYYSNTNPFHKFKSGVVADSLKLNGGGGWITTLIPSQWTTTGSDIYYNTGNVGIGLMNPTYNLDVDGGFRFNHGDGYGKFLITSSVFSDTLVNISTDIENTFKFDPNNKGMNFSIGKNSPLYKLDVNGLIGGSNIETNTTSLSTKLGYEAGLNENESAARYNTLLGYKSGRALTTQTNNTIVGYNAGVTVSGSANSIFGVAGTSISGDYNAVFGYASTNTATSITNNSIFGAYSGYNLTTGDNNTFVGYSAGRGSTTASGSVNLGYFAGYYETGSNKLFIDNQDRTSEATARTSSLIYGEFNATPASQLLRVNGNLESLYLKTNSSNYTVKLGIDAGRLDVSSGDYNTYIGSESGYSNVSSDYNTFIGGLAGYNHLTGGYNTFVGINSGVNHKYGTGNIYIGRGARYYGVSNSDELVIDNQIRGVSANDSALVKTQALIYGKFAADPADQTLTINGSVNIPYNLTVGQLLIHDHYEAAAYVDQDSTITTNVTTDWTYLGAGSNNKFTNIYADGFTLTGDTLMFEQAAYDTRDSIEFNVDYSCATATSNVNKTISYTIRLKSVGETSWREVRQVTRKVRTTTAAVYYSGAICSTMPLYLKDGDKIQISVKNAASTSTVSTQDFGIYLREE